MKSQTQTIAKWKKGVAGGQAAYSDGIDHPTRDWATATAASADKWANGVATAAQNGHFARGVQAGGVDKKWHDRAKSVGAQRWSSSVTDPATITRYTAGVAKLYGFINHSLAAIANMPNVTPADRDARMLAYIAAMRSAKQAAH